MVTINVAPPIAPEAALEIAYHDAAATLKLINETRRKGLPRMNSNQVATLLHAQKKITATLGQMRLALR